MNVKVIAFPGTDEVELEAIASRIKPLAESVLPSRGFIVLTRNRLLALVAATSKAA